MKQAENPDETKPERSLVKDIKRNFGIDVGEIVGEISKDYVKENVLGQKPKRYTPRGKFGRTLDALKDAWWVPAAVYFSFMLALIGGKVMAKMAGVEI